MNKLFDDISSSNEMKRCFVLFCFLNILLQDWKYFIEICVMLALFQVLPVK